MIESQFGGRGIDKIYDRILWTTKESLESIKYLYDRNVDLYIVSSGGYSDKFIYFNTYLNNYLIAIMNDINLNDVNMTYLKLRQYDDEEDYIATDKLKTIFKNIYLNFEYFLTNRDLVKLLNDKIHNVPSKGTIILEIIKKYYSGKKINKLLFI